MGTVKELFPKPVYRQIYVAQCMAFGSHGHAVKFLTMESIIV